MSDKPRGREPQPTDSHRGLRLLALTAVVLGLLVLVAAAFVLSYSGIHAIALSAGVSPRLARLYPLILDAMLVIAFAAVLSLRGAGVFSRCYAWLSMLVLLAAAAAGGVAHATNVKLPHKPAAAAAAIIPWALVLIGFSLLLSMLRQARLRRQTLAAAQESTAVEPTGNVVLRHGIDDLLSPKRPADAPTVNYGGAPAKADPAADPSLDLAIDTEPGQDDPASDEAHQAAAPGNSWNPRAREEQPAGYGSRPAAAFSPAPTVAVDGDTGTDTAAGSPRGTEAAAAARPAPPAQGASGASTVPAGRPASSNGSRPTAQPAPKSASAPAAGAIPGARVAPENAPTPLSNPAPPDRPSAETGDQAKLAVPADPHPPAAGSREPQPAADTTLAAEPKTGASPATATVPLTAAKPTDAAAPAADADDAAEAGLVATAGPLDEPEPGPLDEAEPAPVNEPEPGPLDEAEPGPVDEAEPVNEAGPELAENAESAPEAEAEPASEPQSESRPAPEAEPGPETAAEAPAALPRFDRVRSSPVPPEA